MQRCVQRVILFDSSLESSLRLCRSYCSCASWDEYMWYGCRSACGRHWCSSRNYGIRYGLNAYRVTDYGWPSGLSTWSSLATASSASMSPVNHEDPHCSQPQRLAMGPPRKAPIFCVSSSPIAHEKLPDDSGRMACVRGELKGSSSAVQPHSTSGTVR